MFRRTRRVWIAAAIVAGVAFGASACKTSKENSPVNATEDDDDDDDEEDDDGDDEASEKPKKRRVKTPSPSPGEVTIVPPLRKKWGMGMEDCAYLRGWNKAGTAFGYCAVSGGSGCTTCEFIKTNGRRSKFNDCGHHEPSPRKAKRLRAKLKALGLEGKKPKTHQAKRWAHGGDLDLHWRDLTHSVQFGACLKGTKDCVYLVKFSRKPADECITHLPTAAVSPDGKWVGAMGHGWCGEYTDSYHTKAWPVSRFAASVYNSLGLRFHRKKGFKRSSELFRKAVLTSPKHKFASYNLACALALLKDDAGAEAALRKAIEPGGRKMKRRAKKDKDFEGVKSKEWFKKLVK